MVIYPHPDDETLGSGGLIARLRSRGTDVTVVAVAEANHMYANVRKVKDLPSKWVKELQDFFVNHHNLEGKKYRLLGCKGRDTAFRLIKEGKSAV